MPLNCPKCHKKFTFQILPKLLGCFHVMCQKCIETAFNSGDLTCAICNSEQIFQSPNGTLLDKRTIGKVFLHHKSTKPSTDDESASSVEVPHSDEQETCLRCPDHDLHYSYVETSTMKSGCDRCLETMAEDEEVIRVEKLNVKLLDDYPVDSKIKANLSRAGKCLTGLEAQLKSGSNENLELKVEEFFDKIHNALEFRENEILSKIDQERTKKLQYSQKVQETIEFLENLLEMYNKSKLDTKTTSKIPNWLEMLKKYENEVENLNEIDTLSTEESQNSLNVVVQENFEDILKTLIFVEDRNMPHYETPPDSSSEEEGSSVLKHVQEFARTNSEAASSFESSTIALSPEKNPREVLHSVETSKNPDVVRTCTIVDIDGESSSEDESSDSTADEDYQGHGDELPPVYVALHKRVEVIVKSFEDPSMIWVTTEEDEVLYRMRNDLNTHYRKFEAELKLRTKQCLDRKICAVKDVEWKMCAVKLSEEGWFRARIINVSEDYVDMLLVDLGRRHRQEGGGLTFILPLDQQFFFPSLTFAVKLDKILPLGNGKEWSRHSREKVKSLIEEAHSVELQVTGPDNDEQPFQAIMWVKMAQNDDPMAPILYTDLNIADVLLEEGLAITETSLKKALSSQKKGSKQHMKLPVWRKPRSPPLKFRCRVEWVDYQCNFHVTPEAWEAEKDEVTTQVDSMFMRRTEAAHWRDKTWSPGEAAIAKWTDGRWYRAEVEDTEAGADREQVAVLLVDFGTRALVSRRHLSAEVTAALLQVPSLALPVQLDIRPRGDTWAAETLDTIHRHVDGETLAVETRFFGNPFPLMVKMSMGGADGVVDMETYFIDNNLARKGFRERMRL